MPDIMCGAACRPTKSAVVWVTGYRDHPNATRETYRLYLCAECAGPLLKKGTPVSQENQCPPP
jgi:hypothetical protein